MAQIEITMFKTIEGVYRNGNVKLSEKPDGVDDGMPVLVTFLDAGKIDLRTRGIDKKQAAELRAPGDFRRRVGKS